MNQNSPYPPLSQGRGNINPLFEKEGVGGVLIWKQIKDFWLCHTWFGEIFIFIVFVALYLPLQQSSTFADPDSFYHLKLAELLAARGLVRDFVWLPFTTLADSYADHHFLYHLLLIPFIKIFGSFSGMKIATAVFAAAAVAALAWSLRRLGVGGSLFFAAAAGIMNPLVFRIGLSKASALGVLLLVVGLTLAIERRVFWLGLVAYIYVWTHGGWPALLILGTLAIIIVSLSFPPLSAKGGPASGGKIRGGRGSYEYFKPLLMLWLGTIAGLIINPFFPNNLKFYWEQIVQIAVVNYQGVIGVGAEWYSYSPTDLVSLLPLLCLLIAAAFIIFPFVVYDDRPNNDREIRAAAAFSFAAMIFLVMTLRSRRHIEYFVPLAVAAAALWIGRLRNFNLGLFIKKYKIAAWLLLGGFISFVIVFGRQELAKARQDLSSGYKFTLYRNAAVHLKTLAAPDEVVVHADWDDFPSLFYWNDANRYIMGLDPTFLYRADSGLYWRYVDFTLGKSDDPAGVMKELNARFVFSDRQHNDLEKMLNQSGLFKRVYIDEEAVIYEML